MTLLSNLLLLVVLFNSGTFESVISQAQKAMEDDDLTMALKYSKEAESMVDSQDELGRVYWQRGRIYALLKDALNSNHFYYAAANVYEHLGNHHYAAQIYQNAGTVLLNNTVYKGAVDVYAVGLEQAKLSKNYRLIAALEYDLGLANKNNGDATKALECFLNAHTTLRLQGNVTDDWLLYSKIHNSIGMLMEVVAQTEGDDSFYDSALIKYKMALEFAEDDVTRFHPTNNIGNVYLKRGELESAYAYFETCMRYGESLGSSSLVIPTLNNMGIVNWKLGKRATADSLFRQSVALNMPDSNVSIDFDLSRGVRVFNPEELYVSCSYLDSLLDPTCQNNLVAKIQTVLINQFELERATTKQLLTYYLRNEEAKKEQNEQRKMIVFWAIIIGLTTLLLLALYRFARYVRMEKIKKRSVAEEIKKFGEQFNV